MNTNLFYFNTINNIGGVETFFWNLARKYGKTFDITILYRNGDPAQVRRLSDYVRTRRYREGEIVKCKRCFTAFNCDLLDFIEAEEYYQILHGDYRSLGVIPDRHPKIQHFIAVSDVVKQAYQDITGEIPETCHNPVIIDKPKKVLRLVSATRLTPDKGWNRMEGLAKILEDSGIPFVWDVYTNQSKAVTSHNIMLHESRLDILDYIAGADYYVQLSDGEGYCYSVVESLSVGTPVIVTDFPVAREIGVVDGVNGFILPMDMSKVPVRAIYKGLKKFEYKPLDDDWQKFLIPCPPDWEEEMKQLVTVRCKKVYWDIEQNRMVSFGEEWQVTRKRAEALWDAGVAEEI